MQIEAFAERKKKEWESLEYQAWISGYYVMRGVAHIMSKKNKYPDNPLKVEEVVVEDMELTEEEKEFYTDKLFGKLMAMKEKHDRFNKKQDR